MRIVDCDYNFEVKFDHWKALGYLKSYPLRRLALWLTTMGTIEDEVKAYDKESDRLLEKYIENSERELMNQIPF